ncbi:IucA/IucC family siderophore biosynthesis protein, partial [Streptomyces cavourensis]
MPTYPASHDAAEPRPLLSPPELNRQVWDRAAARLLAKMLGEFAYEEIIEPERRPGDGRLYSLTLDDGTELRFTARRGVYGSWRVDPDSIGTAHPPANPLSNGASSHHASADGAQDGTLRPFRDPLRFLTRARSLL